MSDIVDRLRQGVDADNIRETEDVLDRAADEIERLTRMLENAEKALQSNWVQASDGETIRENTGGIIARLTRGRDALRAALQRLELAYRSSEISGSLWDKENEKYIPLGKWFARTLEQKP